MALLVTLEGNVVLVTATLKVWNSGTSAYDLTDPTELTFYVRRPDLTETESYPADTAAEVTHPSTGKYELRYVPPAATPGAYKVLALSPGPTARGEAEADFIVKDNQFASI